MAEKIIKNCCRHCVEQNINCLGCCIAAGHPEAPKFKEYCDDCVTAGECIKKFQNMKDRNVCWVLGDEDREIYRKENPEFDAKLKADEKKAEEAQADMIDEKEAERLEKMLELRKKRLAEKKDKEGKS